MEQEQKNTTENGQMNAVAQPETMSPEEARRKAKYRVFYKESAQTLGLISRLLNYDVSDITCKFLVVLVGVVVFVMMQIYGDPGHGTVSGMVLFILKYIVYWIGASAAFLILNRTLWRRVLRSMSDGDGGIMYERRMEGKTEPRKAEILFLEDRIVTVSGERCKEFQYGQVKRLLETEDVFGIAYEKDMQLYGGPSGMLGFPKDSMTKGTVEGLEQFLREHCARVKRKTKKL